MDNRVIVETNENGNPIQPIVDLGNAFDGSMTKTQLRELMAETKLSHKKFWIKYLSRNCGFSTFRTWYTEKRLAPVPQFLLVHLTARYPELYALFKNKIA